MSLIFCSQVFSHTITAQTFTKLEIRTGKLSCNPSLPLVFNNKIYFAALADDSITGKEVWYSDGSIAGTKLFRNLKPGQLTIVPPKALSSNPRAFMTFENKFVFAADSSGVGEELWISDGTPAGTRLVKDINPGAGSSAIILGAVIGNKLLFGANNFTNGNELWITDGTDTGTHLVKDINPGKPSSMSTFVGSAILNGVLYFTAEDDANGIELWKSDGTANGTQIVKNIVAGSSSSYAGKCAVFNNKVYFVATESTYGEELWVTDGTDANTKIFKDVKPGKYYGSPNNLFVFNNRLYFTAASTSLTSLWSTDGNTTDSIKRLGDGSSPLFYARYFTPYNGKLYFVASSYDEGVELWQTDGSSAGTKLAVDVFPGAASGYPDNMIVFDNSIYFTAQKDSNNFQLFKTDGSQSGTVQIPNPLATEKNPFSNDLYKGLVATSNALFMRVAYDTFGVELWKLEPTLGTNQIENKNQLLVYPNPAQTAIMIAAKTGGKLSISDASGKCIFENPNWNLEPVSLCNFPTGIYFISLQTAEGIFHSPFIK